MRIIKKYRKKVFLLVFMCLMFIVQARAQFFEDDDGPGDFDPPPDNDVPLDSYQWIMLFLALAYGLFIFWKHHKKNKTTAHATLRALPEPVAEQYTINQTKNTNHDTVCNIHRPAFRDIRRVPFCTGKRSQTHEKILWIHNTEEKQTCNEQSSINPLSHCKKIVMKQYLIGFLLKPALRSLLCLAALIICAGTLANDGKQPSTVAVKGSVPVSYYQAFMIALAVIYGVYLIVRAKRRKRNNRITE